MLRTLLKGGEKNPKWEIAKELTEKLQFTFPCSVRVFAFFCRRIIAMGEEKKRGL